MISHAPALFADKMPAMSLELVLIAVTVAFIPLHEYWVRQAKHDYDETFRRRKIGDQLMPFFVGAWALVLLYSALR